MKIRNTLKHARDVIVDGAQLTAKPGAQVDVPDEVGRSLLEQDGWARAAAKPRKAKAATKKTSPPVPPAETVEESDVPSDEEG